MEKKQTKQIQESTVFKTQKGILLIRLFKSYGTIKIIQAGDFHDRYIELDYQGACSTPYDISANWRMPQIGEYICARDFRYGQRMISSQIIAILRKGSDGRTVV